MTVKRNKTRRFLVLTLLGSIVVLGIITLINIWIDIFGLFGDGQHGDKKIYHNEKTSKYIMSYNYIPSRFKGVLIGPSLSDNLDVTKLWSGELKYYNASVMGANISELKQILNNVIKYGDVQSVIICLHPYLTKDSGSKGGQLDQALYYEAFGSLNLYQTYALYVIREYDLMPHKFPKEQYTFYGTNDYNALFRVKDVAGKIKEESILHQDEPIEVDEMALEELDVLLKELRQKEIVVSAYFHPIPAQIWQANESEHRKYQNRVSALFFEDELILDFNTDRYLSFRDQVENYIDHGHLSHQGLRFVEKELNSKMLGRHQSEQQNE
ncbi:hypothetical protein N6H18_00415 [Reichenbachiella agarivorans]|uniref:SGNH/GDSL hydrolase family protein n=1 Tax=Reichenbachiella agarivorans TaxID=2979464 RepID=A0ABY6CSL4_9BACT|nr:hypothetical protein [Reichenbachiella agarivorans]UXP32438.1 hypothetical protein N6H18_00415 [Reichenbachiella agarivorans]